MARFTKALRQQIVREFCLRRNAEFDARLFEREVRETGPSHRAFAWFAWDTEKAALNHRIWQAREFASGLRVKFTIEEVGRDKSITIREVDAPMLISPLGGRQHGGGYWLVDSDNPAHMGELCRQAASDLERWLRRYRGVIAYAGGSVAAVERQMKALEAAVPGKAEEAA